MKKIAILASLLVTFSVTGLAFAHSGAGEITLPEEKKPGIEMALVVLVGEAQVSIHIPGKDIDVVDFNPKNISLKNPKERSFAARQHLVEVLQEMADEGWELVGQSAFDNITHFTFSRKKS